MTVETDRLLAAYKTARCDLLAEREASGHWVGRLSSSALSTATAISALVLAEDDGTVRKDRDFENRISGSLDWLLRQQNQDGGWGDTDKSFSNISTTMLVRAAFQLAGKQDPHAGVLTRADKYIEAQGGIPALKRRYGKDKTFAVPILTNCALAGQVAWREVSPLPFELACFPQKLYRFLRMDVVSYAIPALVAIGQARFFHRKPLNPITRLVRAASVNKSLRVLENMQPESGGFLEAIPLTSFVVMGLASTNRADHPVVRRGVEFLLSTRRPDGSWPIDTNLATWNTTLSVNALAAGGQSLDDLNGGEECLNWILECQHRQRHPFTGAAPGGWAWTDRSGGVPDVDDTAGALLALVALRKRTISGTAGRIDPAALAGVEWLLDVQNSNGGWPTFCRGWGKLPFDRSGSDLTAHALRALNAWRKILRQEIAEIPPELALDTRLLSRIGTAIQRGFRYLANEQRQDGSWVPLWFGNQHHRLEENLVYGTARVLMAYRDLDRLDRPEAQRSTGWLKTAQNQDGGWGGRAAAQSPYGSGHPSSVEETALAVEALLAVKPQKSLQDTLSKGLTWLANAVEENRHGESSPIGFYFAKLWYHERLYPLIFTVSALGHATGLAVFRSEFKPATANLPTP